jgi:hypothetical protein
MFRAAALVCFLMLAWASCARAQPNPCGAAPAVAPEPKLPKDPPRQIYQAAALRGYEAWAAPHSAYAACRRDHIDKLGKRINALGSQINGLVDETAAVDARVRAAREQRNAAYRAYAERRKRDVKDLPVAPRVVRESMTPPCAVAPLSAAPDFPDGAKANANQMRRADEALNAWAAPLESFVACQRTEREALGAEHDKLRAELAAAQTEFTAYRSAYNAAVKRFERGMRAYAQRLEKTR